MAPWTDTAGFFATIADKPQLDILSDEAILKLRDVDFDEVYIRACKIIPNMMHTEFSTCIDREYYADLVQAACIGVMKAVESWKPSAGSSITTWAYRLARQAVVKELEKEQKYTAFCDTHDFSEVYEQDEESMLHKNDTYETSESVGENAMIWKAEYFLIYQQLTPMQQDVLDLLREGNTYREMSDILGISTTHIGRVVARIQQIVAELEGDKTGT